MLSRLVSKWIARPARGAAPDHAQREVEALLDEGVTLHRDDYLDAAERCYLKVLVLDPYNFDALNLLGSIALARVDYDAALDYFENALRLRPGTPTFLENIGLALSGLGRPDEALEAMRKALEIDPACAARVDSNILYILRVHPTISEEECFRAHREWARRFSDQVPRLPVPTGRCANPVRRLRIGYLSGDFRLHAVSAFLEVLLNHRDRTSFDVYCYKTLRQEDELTDRFRSNTDHWHDVFELDDDALVALVRSHEIDILVDLAGITSGQRVQAIARRPAPVQIGYLGYLGSTGTSALDYRITDALADPPGHSERFHTERLVRLPRTQWCYTPSPSAPEPLPALGDGPIRFGSFHRLTKLHSAQLTLWAELLARTPGTELDMVDISSIDTRERVLAPFVERGVAPERIRTHSRLKKGEYWDLMCRTHIALDAYPYNGGASTCEALWVGVPVISRVGRHGFSRSGASILCNAGLSELVAYSDDEFIDIAARLAADRDRLAALRASLRDRLRASPLLDGPGFMCDLESAYRAIWAEYCARSAS
jgi:protein O-GlcNAc transferase